MIVIKTNEHKSPSWDLACLFNRNFACAFLSQPLIGIVNAEDELSMYCMGGEL